MNSGQEYKPNQTPNELWFTEDTSEPNEETIEQAVEPVCNARKIVYRFLDLSYLTRTEILIKLGILNRGDTDFDHLKILNDMDDGSIAELEHQMNILTNTDYPAPQKPESENIMTKSVHATDYFDEEHRKSFLEREKKLKVQKEWPNTNWYNDKEFYDLYYSACQALASAEKQLKIYDDLCNEQGEQIEKLEAENRRLREANIKYEITIMAQSPYLRHTKECPLYEFIGLQDKNAPICTCGLDKATGYEQALKEKG